MYTFEQETKQVQRRQDARRVSSGFYPVSDFEQEQQMMPFDDEQTYMGASENEVQEYNKVSGYSEETQESKRQMYIQTLNHERKAEKSSFRLNARGKIAICVFSIIFAALVAFSIYNAVIIGQLNTSVALKNQAVVGQTAVINDLTAEYNGLAVNVEEGFSMGYRPTTEADFVEVVASPRATKTTTQIESNWFDRLCEFFSKLFG